jgi:anti-anti-sigma factor
MADFDLRIEEIPDVLESACLVVLTGSLDTRTVREFQARMNSLRERGVERFVLDMTGVHYVNSTGLGYLVNLGDPQVNPIHLFGIVPNVRVVFDMLGLNNFLRIFPDRKAALEPLQRAFRTCIRPAEDAFIAGDRDEACRLAQAGAASQPDSAGLRRFHCEMLRRCGVRDLELAARRRLYADFDLSVPILSYLADRWADEGDALAAWLLREKLRLLRDPAAPPVPPPEIAGGRRAALARCLHGRPDVDPFEILELVDSPDDPLGAELAVSALAAWPERRREFFALLAAHLPARPWFQLALVSALGRGNPDAVPFLTDLAGRRGPEWLHRAAVRVLSELEGDAVDRYFLGYLASCDHHGTESLAVEHFRGRDDALLPALAARLQDGPPAYVLATGRLGSVEAVRALLSRAPDAGDARFAVIVRALRESGSPHAVEALERLLDLSRALRAQAEAAGDRIDLEIWTGKLKELDPAGAPPPARAARSVPASAADLLQVRSEIDEQIRARYVKRVAVMMTDLAGFTPWSERQSLGSLIARHDAMLRPLFGAHGGTVIKSIGDAFLVTFEDADRAVDCAGAVLRGIEEGLRGLGDGERVRLKVALHDGEALLCERDVYGDVVNTVSRLEKLARPGETIVSESLLAALKRKPAAEDLGVRKLRGKTERLRVYRLSAGPAPG